MRRKFKAANKKTKPITNIEPWRKGVLAAAYRKIAFENWDKVETAAIKAQGIPNFED